MSAVLTTENPKTKENMTIDDMFPKDHIVGADIGEGKSYALVIEDFRQQEVWDIAKSKKERRKVMKTVWVLRFKGAAKHLILNVTNAESVVEIAGSRKMADWVGKTVELYAKWVDAFGKRYFVVRIRKVTER
ncbi:hypothetical protein LCGC14_0607680 [marine sediment metagenome]|uniref:Uncharacterized protein n=1 Tax=marine sediment metagenome TaxID=412755 RepID=A0A0F9TUW6_9ZZZZ